MYTSDNNRSIALILKDLEHLFYSLYHNHIKQLLHIVTYRGLNRFVVIFPFITGSRKKKKKRRKRLIIFFLLLTLLTAIIAIPTIVYLMSKQQGL